MSVAHLPRPSWISHRLGWVTTVIPASIRPLSIRPLSIRPLSMLPLSILLASCGGGSSGGSSSSSSSTAKTVVSPPASLVAAGYNYNNYIQPINVTTVWAAGYSGAGVTVGEIDGFIDTTAPGLTGSKVTSQTSYVGSYTPASDHATAVASWIVGSAQTAAGGTLSGVAYSANLRAYAIFAALGGSTFVPYSSSIASAFAQARADGVKIVNNSWGSASTSTGTPLNSATDLAEWANDVASGQVLVWSAGNTSSGGITSQPSNQGRAPLQNSALTSGWLVVGNYNSATGKIDSSSNLCGQAAAWCLLAPGTNLVGWNPNKDGTTGSSTGYAQWTGTSMAAAVVSGALAVVVSTGKVSTQTARTILLSTATYMGDETTNGQGLLNVKAALQPYGISGVPVSLAVTGATASLSASVIQSGGAAGNALGQGVASLSMPFLDKFNRLYQTPLAPFNRAYNLPLFGSLAVKSMASTVNGLQTGPSLAVGDEIFGLSTVGLSTVGMTERSQQAVGVMGVAHGLSATLTAGMTNSRFTSTGSLGDSLSPAVRDPYLGFSSNGVSFNSVHQDSGMGFTLTSGRDDSDAAQVHTLAASYTHLFGDGSEMRLSSGYLAENHAALGTTGFGALAITGTTQTLFTSLSARATRGIWQLAVGAATGQSSLQGQSGSLITGFNALSSTAWLEISSADVVPGTLSFTLSQPLRVEQGAFKLNTVYDRTYDGALLRRNITLNAAPTGREVDAGLTWTTEPLSNTHWSNAVVLRSNPGHDAAAVPDLQLLTGLAVQF